MAQFVERGALLRQGRTVPSSITQVDSVLAWRTAGLRARSPVKQRTAVRLEVGPELRSAVDEMLEDLGPATGGAFSRRLGRVARAAFFGWPDPPPGPPDRTGLSKSLLALQFSVDPGGDEVVGTLRDDAPYAGFIWRGRAIRELLFKPTEAAAAQIADDIARTLAKGDV